MLFWFVLYSIETKEIVHLMTYSRFYLWLCDISYMVKNHSGRKEMLYLMMHSTHFIYGYIVSDLW